MDDYEHAINMVEKLERGPIFGFSAETRYFASFVRSVNDAWKDASGTVRPQDLRNKIAHLVEHEAERSRMILNVEKFCHQCTEGGDPGVCPDCPLYSISGGK